MKGHDQGDIEEVGSVSPVEWGSRCDDGLLLGYLAAPVFQRDTHELSSPPKMGMYTYIYNALTNSSLARRHGPCYSCLWQSIPAQGASPHACACRSIAEAPKISTTLCCMIRGAMRDKGV